MLKKKKNCRSHCVGIEDKLFAVLVTISSNFFVVLIRLLGTYLYIYIKVRIPTQTHGTRYLYLPIAVFKLASAQAA